MHTTRTALLLFVVSSVFPGCGDEDPADVAGSYTVSVTSRTNGCEFDNWTEGESATAIPVTISQDGDMATATLEGLAGAWLNLVLGSNEFTGKVSGNDMELTLFGTTTGANGNCTWTVNSTFDVTLDGDAIEGEIRYEKATNGNPDCAPFEGCISYQDVNGTRPPS
jgi:hypothetical protein